MAGKLKLKEVALKVKTNIKIEQILGQPTTPQFSDVVVAASNKNKKKSGRSGMHLYKKEKHTNSGLKVKGVCFWAPVLYDTINWAESLSWLNLTFVVVAAYAGMALVFAAVMLPLNEQLVFTEDIENVDSKLAGVFFFISSNLISLGCEFAFPNSTGTHLLTMLVQFTGILMNLLLFGVMLSKFTRKKEPLIISKSATLSKVCGVWPCHRQAWGAA